MRCIAFIFYSEITYMMSFHLSAGTWCLWIKKMVLVPWIWPPTPWANHPNLFAEEWNHTSVYFGWVINCLFFINFPESSSKISFAYSTAHFGLLPSTACTNSSMRIWFRVWSARLDSLAVACAYLDCVVGPLSGGALRKGLSMTAFVSTLGAATIFFGGCCKPIVFHPWFWYRVLEGDCFVLLLFGYCCVVENPLQPFQCWHSLSPHIIYFTTDCQRKIPDGFDYLILGCYSQLCNVTMLEKYCVGDPFTACLFAEDFVAMIVFHQRANVPTAEWVWVPWFLPICTFMHLDSTSQWR